MKGYLIFTTAFLLFSALHVQAQELSFSDENPFYQTESDASFDESIDFFNGFDVEDDLLEPSFPPPEEVDLSSVKPIEPQEFQDGLSDRVHPYPSPIEMLSIAKQLELEMSSPKIQITQSRIQNPDKISAAISLGRLISLTLMALKSGNDRYLKNNFLLIKKGSNNLELNRSTYYKIDQIDRLLTSDSFDRTQFAFEMLELSHVFIKQSAYELSDEKRLFNDIVSLSIWLQAVDFISEGTFNADQLSALQKVIAVPHIYDDIVKNLNHYDEADIEKSHGLNKLKLYMNRLRAFFTRQKLTQNLLTKAKAILKIYLP
ncbi:MAG: hypothetical protein GY786_23440 [Proteobacteria bacterium]|nr:hypothetical protein [Pseudomonadota bacterium]